MQGVVPGWLPHWYVEFGLLQPRAPPLRPSLPFPRPLFPIDGHAHVFTLPRSPLSLSLPPVQDALTEATKRVAKAKAHAENEKETRERAVEEAKQNGKRVFDEAQAELEKKTRRISDLEAENAVLQEKLSAERTEHAALRETEAAARLILFPAEAFNSGAAGPEAHDPPQGQDGGAAPAGLVAVEGDVIVVGGSTPAASPAGSSGPATPPAVNYADTYKLNGDNPAAQTDVLCHALAMAVLQREESSNQDNGFSITEAYRMVVPNGKTNTPAYATALRLMNALCPSTRHGWRFDWNGRTHGAKRLIVERVGAGPAE